jgi:twinkle protein
MINEYPMGGMSSRGVPESVYFLFGVRHTCHEETGEVDRVFYPYYSGKEVVGYKVRNLPKRFVWAGAAAPTLFGKNLCSSTGGRFLFVGEGEEDAIAIKAMLLSASSAHDVVALPNGAALDKIVRSELDFFSGYSRVYLALDNDKPGKEAADQIADWLSPVTEVRLLEFAPDMKDPSQYLTEGRTREFLSLFKKAKIYEPEGVVNGMDIDLESLLVPMPEGAYIPYDGLQEKLHGIRKGEILTICAGTGIGKSTLIRELGYNLTTQGFSVAHVALEDQMNVTAQAMMALDMNIPLARFRLSPPPKSECQPSYDKLIADGKTYFYKHFGGLNSETLLNKMYYYARSKECDYILLDHLSMAISSTASNNERKDIDTLMTKLAKMVVETGVGLIQVVHLKRKGDGTSYAKGGEVELSDLRGSAALEQLSWGVIAMERDQQGDDRDFSKLRVLKNRTFGFTGLCDHLRYDSITGRLVTVKPEEPAELETEAMYEHSSD